MPSIDPEVPFPFHCLKGDPLSTDGRLTGAITIAGARFWCEALPVKNTEDGEQVGCDENSESRRLGLIAEFDSCDFQTLSIKRKGVRRDYVLVIIPGDR